VVSDPFVDLRIGTGSVSELRGILLLKSTNMRHSPHFKNAVTCLLTLATCSGLRAQITEVGTLPELLTVVRSIPTAGVKLYSYDQNSLTMYNLDLSVFATITYPPLPTGYNYFAPVYLTESTFDNDPLSIELMMLTTDTSGVTGTRVIRDDGTVLFDEPGYTISGGGGYDDVNDRPPLFTGEDGIAYMNLTTYPINPPISSKLYQLPGSLPCFDCATGWNLGIGQHDLGTNTGELSLFPNPATDQLTVDYTLSSGATNGRLVVLDALGKLVANISLNGSGRTHVPISGYPSGTYSCVLLTDGQRQRSERFVVGE